MGRGFPTFLVASFIIFSLSLCQLKCWWGLILDSEQVQALAESLPRNTSFGKNFHGFLLPPATLTVQAWFCSKATVHTLTRTAECVGDKVSMLFLAGAERKAHFGTALGVKLPPKRLGNARSKWDVGDLVSTTLHVRMFYFSWVTLQAGGYF